MPNLLRLAEIAAIYRCTTKTFLKYVVNDRIPHQRLGKARLFDLDEVAKHLRHIEQPFEKTRLKTIKAPAKNYRSEEGNKYRALLGLDV